MNNIHPPVLIVGAGPAGLVAALSLVQNGVRVRIIDKDPNPRIGQRGPGIWPRSLELFNFLNVPEVNDRGKLTPLIRSYKPGTLEPLGRNFGGPAYGSYPSGTIPPHQEKFSCSVEMGTELLSFEQSDHGVTAVLAKNGISETFDTKWMIGADGAKGVVRKQLGLMFLGETRDDAWIVTGDIRLKGVGLDRVYWHRFGNFHERGISLRPTDEVGEDGWQFFIFGQKLDMTKIAQSEELLFQTIDSLIPTEVTFNKLVWVSELRTNIRMVNKFSEGRVFVAGDAAHVHSPTGGQGLNSSVQDTFNLGWKLALVAKGLADKSLLETYNAERFPVISEMLNMTTSILNHAMKTGEMTSRRTPILFMLGVNCRSSSIVLDEFVIPVEGKPINAYGVLDEGHLEAGDRAPDASNMLQVGRGASDVKTLFSLYRPWYHTVLVFVPSLVDATPILGALEAFDKSVVRLAVILPSSAPVTAVASPADHVFVDQESYAHLAYLVEANHTKVFVIRPDGVVGAIVHGAGGVKKYFSRIFCESNVSRL
ncbi:FAD binding domain-containing protein [Suillus paluster]|uniref:FAD binding domain-containing protein n=1 Tax=Suillus paluster TaxID=48578 RepID=UPI001B86647E|nr:FAD binding domain-containing protein [Suillus paluster]KAG1745453.1 FAD binding domain-containing protein [Suillus paluster]